MNLALHFVGRRVLGIFMAMAAPAPLALVHGRAYEENSLRIALALPQYYAGRVVLVAADPAQARAHLTILGSEAAGSAVEVVQVRSITAVWLFVRARYVFYTHGLYGSPRPGHRRVHVNLWHGHGPKRTGEAVIAQDATLMVSNTQTWGSWAAHSRGMAADALLVVGNPRQDAFEEPAPRRVLERLGVDPSRPLVLWLPTHRELKPGQAEVTDAGPSDGVLHPAAEILAATAKRLRVTLLVKAHALDESTFQADLRLVRGDDIFAAGLSLYGLLSLSSALVSDYSSVWVEYLELDRPVGLICPDLEYYEAVQGFKSPRLREVASPLLLRTVEEMETFMLDISRGHDWQGDQRRHCMRQLGVTPGTQRTRRLLRELNVRAQDNLRGEPFHGA